MLHMDDPQNELVVFMGNSSSSPVELVFDGQTIWATQEQIALAFDVTVSNVSLHIKNIYKEGELLRANTFKESLKVVDKGPRKQIKHYNLDVVISVGYRVNSKKGTRFRQWATREISARILSGVIGSAQSKDEQRIAISDRVAVENAELLHSAQALGVQDGVAFYNAGYQGMYSMKMQDIIRHKRLGSDRLLDRAGITELAANEFRITQANALLKDLKEEDGILVGHGVALQTHWQVGQRVREAIGDIGGQMPEDLPVEPDHISDVRKRVLVEKVKPKELEKE